VTAEELRDGLSRFGIQVLPISGASVTWRACEGSGQRGYGRYSNSLKPGRSPTRTAQQGYADGVYSADRTLQLLVDLGLDRDAAELTVKRDERQ